MIKIEYVDVATARNAPGVRLVVFGHMPSPWSEACPLAWLAKVPR
jgi:hypothetical protein